MLLKFVEVEAAQTTHLCCSLVINMRPKFGCKYGVVCVPSEEILRSLVLGGGGEGVDMTKAPLSLLLLLQGQKVMKGGMGVWLDISARN